MHKIRHQAIQRISEINFSPIFHRYTHSLSHPMLVTGLLQLRKLIDTFYYGMSLIIIGLTEIIWKVLYLFR
jgi:hypothetical protein